MAAGPVVLGIHFRDRLFGLAAAGVIGGGGGGRLINADGRGLLGDADGAEFVELF